MSMHPDPYKIMTDLDGTKIYGSYGSGHNTTYHSLIVHFMQFPNIV
jgi:hypothetical protein